MTLNTARFVSPLLLLALLLAGCQSGSTHKEPIVFNANPTTPAPTAAPERPVAVRPATPVASTAPVRPVFLANKLADMDTVINEAIAAKQCPGGVLWLERNGATYHKAYGQRAVAPTLEAMTEDTIFDAASVTKVAAGTPAIMLLVERGLVKLDAPVKTYIPEFVTEGKDAITVRQLLTHVSGLRPDVNTRPAWSGYETAIKLACAEKLQAPPGTVFRYSDINLFLVGEIVERVSKVKLNEFCEREIYRPLKMKDTGFMPPQSKLNRIAPTEMTDGVMLRGVVHDPTARFMGGRAGHAGLFTTAADLARYARMMLNEGTLDGVRIFKPETVRLMTSVQTPSNISQRRGLGWDIDSSYSSLRGKIFPLGSYGHTGFTGTCLWIDPFSKTFWIFMSNRVHPDGKGNVTPLRAQLGTLAAEAVTGFDFSNVAGTLPSRPSTNAPVTTTSTTTTTRTTSSVARTIPVPTSTVLNGIDVLVREKFARLRGLRIGLITNHTGHDRERNPTIDLLHKAEGVRLTKLFSPEHGIRGALDEKINDSVDEKTGLPVFSLYGERRSPTPEQLQDLDALVFDIQDIGCRFYTYPATMLNCLQATAKAKLKFFVLDRVNPIGGVAREGPIHKGTNSFVAWHSVPLRHGMTVGEVARLVNAERQLNADLTVIPVAGWQRGMWFDQTGQPWTNPSPNMRNLNEATLYPGVGLLESAVSVGRGTDTPFELIGAPYVDDVRFSAELNQAGLPGVRFVPIRFKPVASVFKDKPCAGVFMVITDRDQLNAVDLGITLALAFQRLYPKDFAIDKMQTLLQDKPTLEAIKAGKSLTEIKSTWVNDLEAFKQRCAAHLMYK
jgi:uncharacterized protein YbbC (DUF1343 family)/CubicO group peptidase (beta-lactamase class C family)